ncbi:MAG: 4'-phosphopantetheinyl transferase superfamily protein [Bacteroidales bacterium]|nr:4'-phosphopantetheinyl transferase superfamily protein [Bacteroidales bacterium]MDD4602333.1 4'-phosphopantetheinyl transferase superfamily protein [Bacteroidales bacterium]
MPLIKTLYKPDQTVTGIWHITESSDLLLSQLDLSKEELKQYLRFSHDLRKRQWLAYRCILKQILFPDSNELAYDEFGKPRLIHSPFAISVTHAGDYAAAICSKKITVGIDIEKMRDRIERVKDRFLSPQELEQIGPHPSLELLYIYWCAKESLYKLNGKPDLDFKNDIRINAFGYLCNVSHTCTATLALGNTSLGCSFYYQLMDDYMMVVAYSNSEMGK